MAAPCTRSSPSSARTSEDTWSYWPSWPPLFMTKASRPRFSAVPARTSCGQRLADWVRPHRVPRSDDVDAAACRRAGATRLQRRSRAARQPLATPEHCHRHLWSSGELRCRSGFLREGAVGSGSPGVSIPLGRSFRADCPGARSSFRRNPRPAVHAFWCYGHLRPRVLARACSSALARAAGPVLQRLGGEHGGRPDVAEWLAVPRRLGSDDTLLLPSGHLRTR